MQILRKCGNVSFSMLFFVLFYAWMLIGVGDPAAVGMALASDEATPASTSKPQAVYPETTFDFGKIMEGEQIKHDFIIENKGDAPLEIHRVRPD